MSSVSSVRMVRAAVVAVALVVVSGACSGEDTAATSTTTTTSAGAFAPSGGCPMIPPGQVMSASEATIRFAADRVCPGYVTIPVGTTIAVRNEGTESARFVVREGPDGSGATIFDRKLAAGEETSMTFDKDGFHVYTTSLLDSFKGTIEVVAG